jgi:hypothetical protein
MRKVLKVAVPAFFALAFLVPVGAQAHHDKSCEADVAAHCKDVKGKRAVLKCLSEHEAELSEGCKTSHAKFFERMKKKEGAK